MAPNTLVLPGDTVNISASDKKKYVLGPGLRKDGERIIATKAGILKQRSPGTYWVEGRQKRYVPARGDCVIGIVTAKSAENIRVNIGSSEQGSLSMFAFEGATKRNRPDVQVGDLVMAQVLTANRDMEPELVCVNSYGKKGILGVLRSPTAFWMRLPIDLVNRILCKDCPLLGSLGRRIPFEISLGQNGRVWVNANTLKNTLAVCNAIASAENLTAREIKDRCAQLWS
ncbi:exosome complex component RRP40 [Ixodes scapularis]|nr:exosome complex component RRP40 [Ixodes scapularis]